MGGVKNSQGINTTTLNADDIFFISIKVGSTYETRQIKYSDLQALFGANPSVLNGLNFDGTNIKLGGVLTEDTIIDGAFILNLGHTSDGATTPLNRFSVMVINPNNTDEETSIRLTGNRYSLRYYNALTNVFSNIEADDNELEIRFSNGTNINRFAFVQAGQVINDTSNNNAFVIEDNIFSKGLVALNDYTANVSPETYITARYISNQNFENSTNKSDSFTSNSSTTYSSSKALLDGLATKNKATQLFGFNAPINPADNTTYFFGQFITNLTVSAATQEGNRGTALFTGTINLVNIAFWINTSWASSENCILRLHNLTQGTNVVVKNDLQITISALRYYNVPVSLAVNAGDRLEFQLECPTWVTNPVGLVMNCLISTT